MNQERMLGGLMGVLVLCILIVAYECERAAIDQVNMQKEQNGRVR